MVRAIIFDFDGVLEDTFEFCYGIAKTSNPNLTEEKYRQMFTGNFYAGLDKTDFVLTENFDEKYEKQLEKREIDPELKDIVEKLAQEYKCFIISSSSGVVIENYLRRNDILDCFEKTLGYEVAKSKVEKFGMIFAEYDLNNEDCVFVTDTLGDVLEGNAVGVKSIGITGGFHEEEMLSKGEPYKIVNSFEELFSEISELQ